MYPYGYSGHQSVIDTVSNEDRLRLVSKVHTLFLFLDTASNRSTSSGNECHTATMSSDVYTAVTFTDHGDIQPFQSVWKNDNSVKTLRQPPL